jgi:hypothetical protein
MASQMSTAILGQRIDGIWHTGVVVFGIEYYFGGGVQKVPEGSFSRQNGLQPSQMLSLGNTTKTRAELETWLETIRHRYTQQTYDLINHNCNNFSDEVAKWLMSRDTGIPAFIVDLPRTIFSTPMGAMIRPMIEGMQNQVNNMGGSVGGLDPFSHSSNFGGQPTRGNFVGQPVASPPPSTTAPASATVTSMTTTTTSTTSTSIPAFRTAVTLEGQYLVSADKNAGAVYQFGRKLGALEGASEADKALALAVADAIASDHKLPEGSLAVLGRLAALDKKAQMSALFLLRLAVLQLGSAAEVECQLSADAIAVLTALCAEEEDRDGFFSGPPAMVMALCSASNMLSVEASRAWLLRAGYFETLLNAAMSVLMHPRLEVRSMAASLTYNLALAISRAGGWGLSEAAGGVESEEPVTAVAVELPAEAVQILCSVLEGLEDEEKTDVRQRRLRVALYLLRCCGTPAAELARDLGFLDVLLSTFRRSDVHPNESQLLVELNHLLSSPL